MITDWDDAYANGAHIPGADGFPPKWAAAAAAFRDGLGPRAEIDLPYGMVRRRLGLRVGDFRIRGILTEGGLRIVRWEASTASRPRRR